MKRISAVIAAGLLFGVPSLAVAGNPSGTGPPSQSCQEIEAAGGRVTGRSFLSPGSPFNEPELDSENGGVGGQHYAERSQYDVACYQVSRH